jgi:bifunctional polynucleotide phosphatase/kinase
MEGVLVLTGTMTTSVTVSARPEAVVMVGYPAAGKTTIARGIFEAAGYWRVDGDVYGTVAKMLRRADEGLASGAHSVVFDSTGGSLTRRLAFVGWARGAGLPVRAIWVDTPIEEALRRNAARVKDVPPVALYTYRKHFEEPTVAEGFEEIVRLVT